MSPACSAANSPHAAAAVDRWDRRTDARPLHRPCTAHHADSVNHRATAATKNWWQLRRRLTSTCRPPWRRCVRGAGDARSAGAPQPRRCRDSPRRETAQTVAVNNAQRRAARERHEVWRQSSTHRLACLHLTPPPADSAPRQLPNNKHLHVQHFSPGLEKDRLFKKSFFRVSEGFF